ncbi:MAG: hypothetical protein ACOY4I_05830 [Bacillota bacterium]
MFRLGFKKNEEKEMLGRTITELQELRAELSLLKDRLTAIIPVQPGDYPTGPAADEAAVSVCGEHIAEKEDIPAECSGATAAGEEDPGPGPVEEDPGPKPVEEEQEECAPVLEADGPDHPAGEAGPVRKEWAVVSFRGGKRPWWKWWGPKNHLVRRSV